MKVKELIKRLKKCNQEADVILSGDGEGNDYSPLSELDNCMYEPDTTWSGEICYADEMEEDDVYENNAVVLWPIS